VQGQGDEARGAALASYLLFEAPYTRELIALGVADTQQRRDDVLRFFGWGERGNDTSPSRTAAAQTVTSAV
jgi:NTE family protein